MKQERIYCALCGHAADSALFQHLREVHGLTPAEYREKHPHAPLYTESFREFVQQQGVHVETKPSKGEDGEIRVMRELFGVPVSCAISPHPGVPVLDKDYRFDPEQARAVLYSLTVNDRVLLVGPTGAGKSSLIMQLAARLNWPLTRVNLHGETSASDFIGQHKVKDGSVYFAYGVLPQAMTQGHILCLEELDAADPGILFSLQGVLEENGTLTLADNSGEVITPHPRFRLVATANTLGTGDDSGGLYTGTQVLNAAFLDRWTSVFRVEYLPVDEEAKLVTAKAPTLEHALVDGLVKLAGAIRKAIDEEALYSTFSTRRLLAFAGKIGPLGLSRALEVTVLNKLPKTDRAIVSELAQRHLPGLAETT
ncbi:MAG: AAA family ATPase [Planctomycetes bacterium]|nr:AAA family ATPase [Planctomycetota bacterium]